MKINKKDVLVLSVNLTKNKSGEPYLFISFIDAEDGSQYSVTEKNLEVMQKVHNLEKWKVDIEIKSTAKYGMRLSILNWIEKIG